MRYSVADTRDGFMRSYRRRGLAMAECLRRLNGPQWYTKVILSELKRDSMSSLLMGQLVIWGPHE